MYMSKDPHNNYEDLMRYVLILKYLRSYQFRGKYISYHNHSDRDVCIYLGRDKGVSKFRTK